MMTGADMTRFNRLEIVWWAIEVIQDGCSQLHLFCLSEYSRRLSTSDCGKSWHAVGLSAGDIKVKRTEFEDRLKATLSANGYPAGAASDEINWPLLFAIMVTFIVAATALYGPLAACMVELFPTRIRYAAMSFPSHVGTGGFGGLQPAISFAIVTAVGDIYTGLWFPFIVTAVAIMLTLVLLPETRHRSVLE